MFNRLCQTLAAVAAVPLFLPGGLFPRRRGSWLGTTIVTAGSVSEEDAAFAVEAAASGMAEVAYGRLAVDRGLRTEVRDHGQLMIDDHQAANRDLMALALSKRIILPVGLTDEAEAARLHLSTLSGEAFDEAYLDQMIADHQRSVSQFQHQANHGQDHDLTAFAKRLLPTLQRHLQMARDQRANGGKKKKGK